MQVTSTDAKARLSQVLDAAQTEAVVIEKSGRKHSVIISYERYQRLLAAEQPASPTSEAGRRFYEQYKDWVDAHNHLVEECGVFGEEFRPW